MIPKKVHYCWFGGEKPDAVKECIESWHHILTDYEIVEWNQDNFDVNKLQYTREAFKEKKYAFVSDVARVYALYQYGGIYLDTDVKVYKKFDSILKEKCVFGFEEDFYIATSFMACEAEHSVMKEFMKLYSDLEFYDADGNINTVTNVTKLTKILLDKGLQREDKFQYLEDGIVIYPQEYFSPYDYSNCIHHNTDNTICEHLFFVSWMPWTTRVKKYIKSIIGPTLGKDKMNLLRSVVKKNSKTKEGI